jgi:hypothetical protein
MVIDTSTKSKYRGDENVECEMGLAGEVFKRGEEVSPRK